MNTAIMQEEVSPELIDRTCEKLGLSKRPSPDLAGLQTIYEAWSRKVPFDNIRKIIHVNSQEKTPLPGSNATDFLENWLKYGSGGTCWAGNGALCALLQTLGFSAIRGVATMLVAPDLPPNHGTVLVEIENKEYLVDASILHLRPMLLDEERLDSNELPLWVDKISFEQNHWQILWRPMHRYSTLYCRIDHKNASLDEFQERHESTREWSPFNFELTIRSVRDKSMIGIFASQQLEISKSPEVQSNPVSDEERIELLINKFDIAEELVRKIPKDRPTPPPPGTRTALKRASGSAD